MAAYSFKWDFVPSRQTHSGDNPASIRDVRVGSFASFPDVDPESALPNCRIDHNRLFLGPLRGQQRTSQTVTSALEGVGI